MSEEQQLTLKEKKRKCNLSTVFFFLALQRSKEQESELMNGNHVYTCTLVHACRTFIPRLLKISLGFYLSQLYCIKLWVFAAKLNL